MSTNILPRIAALLAALLFVTACGPGARVADPRQSAAHASGDPAAELIALINAERRKAGLPALSVKPALSRAARDHARAMGEGDCFDRDCGGTDFDRRVARAGYRYALVRTDLSAGYARARDVFAAMIGKDWSRELVLGANFRHVGAAYHFQGRDAGTHNYTHYWTVTYGVPANEDVDLLAREVTRLVNRERETRGLAPLALSPLLSGSAQFHARFMADNDCFAHLCPNEPDLRARVRNTGYEYRMIAENIAAGTTDPAQTVRGWMISPGHRANILNPDMREIGVGYVLLNEDGDTQKSRHYWVQNFGARQGG